jgi:hypothetical protein
MRRLNVGFGALSWLVVAGLVWTMKVAGQEVTSTLLPIALGFGVDTTTGPRHEIFGLWRAYLSDRPDSARANRYWSNAEQRRWPRYDLTGGYIYQGSDWAADTRITLVELAPAVPGDSDVYVIRTLYVRAPDSVGAAIQPRALQRVYAVRERGRWVLAGALPRLTASWPRAIIGPITFIYSPSHRFDRRKAERSARFVDSLSRAIGVTVPRRLTFVVAPSPDELARITGLDFCLSPLGRAYPDDALVMSGLPSYGEWYPHELAHVIFRSLEGKLPGPPFFVEGAATWVGGSRGRDYPTLVRELRAVLRERPTLTLDSIVAPHEWTDSISYTSAAVLFDMAHEHGGQRAIRQLLGATDASVTGVFATLEQAIGLPRPELNVAWRHRVMTAGE